MVRPLFSFLCSAEIDLKWHAAELLGAIVAEMAEEDMEPAREIMRRLMWSLNDESGGIGWGAPEAMAEVMARHEGLAREFAPILVSYIREDANFIRHEPLQRGVVWGIGRLAKEHPALLRAAGATDALLARLNSQDDEVRGLAAWALGFLAVREARPKLRERLKDEGRFTLYAEGKQIPMRVGQTAREALARLGPGSP
jgi:HEAT repeat protein